MMNRNTEVGDPCRTPIVQVISTVPRMQVNETKTEFMVVNGTAADRKKIVIDDLIVKHCKSYVYLGVIFTENGSPTSSLKAHVADKIKHLNRLQIFLSRNYDAPFFVKRKVFDAAFSSAILYGCESWIGASLAPMENMYMSAVRRLLDVRKSTPKLTCLLEAGVPSLEAVVNNKRSKFLRRVLEDREDMSESDPLMYTLDFMKTNCASVYDPLHNVIQRDDYLDTDRDDLCRQLYETPPERTKLRLYLEMNPELSVHPLYSFNDSNVIEDNLRIAFTRVRLCSHRLRSETGRWSRIPSDQRFCPHCEGPHIQNEDHIFKCAATSATCAKYGVTAQDFSLLRDPSKTDLTCLKQCLKILESINEPNPDNEL